MMETRGPEVPVTHEAAFEEAIAELLATNAELDALPPGAFERRVELQSRLTEMRARVAELHTQTPADRAALRNRLNRLETELKHRLHHRISHITAGQTGMGGGLDPEYVHALNKEIDRGQGVGQIQEEIAKIRAMLAKD